MLNRRGRKVSAAEKELIVTRWKEGETYREIGDVLGRPHSSIQRVIDAFKEKDRPKLRTGRPLKLNPAERRNIIEHMQQNPDLSVSALAQRVRDSCKKYVCDDTVRKVLKKAGQNDNSKLTDISEKESIFEGFVEEETSPMADNGNDLSPIPINTTDDMPIKSEPCFDDHLAETMTTVPHERYAAEGFLESTTTSSHVNSNPNNNNNSLVNGFVIYELESSAYNINCEQRNIPSVVEAEPTIYNTTINPPPLRYLNEHPNTRPSQILPTQQICFGIPNTSATVSESEVTSTKEASTLTPSTSVPHLLNVKGNDKGKKILNKTLRNAKTTCESALPKPTITSPNPPPILLNTRLRKRSIVMGNQNTATELANKKMCYNSKAMEAANVNDTTENLALAMVSPSLGDYDGSNGTNSNQKINVRQMPINELDYTTAKSKKIINLYLKQNKRGVKLSKAMQQQEKNRFLEKHTINKRLTGNIEPDSPPITKTTIEPTQLETIIKIENPIKDRDTNITVPTQNNNTKPMETISTPIESSITVSQENIIETNSMSGIVQLQEESAVKTEDLDNDLDINATNKTANNISIPIEPPSTDKPFPDYLLDSNILVKNEPITQEESFSSKFPAGPLVDADTQASVSKTAGEIKVKCLCSLTDRTNAGDDHMSSSANDEDLKRFFTRMFEETRRLNKQQQRAVKITLLRAVCEAEDLVENGKFCGF